MNMITKHNKEIKDTLLVTEDELTNFDIVESRYKNDGNHLPMSIKVGREIDGYRMEAEQEIYGSISDITEEIKKEIDEGLESGYTANVPSIDFDGVSLLLIKKTNLMLLFDLFDTSVKYGNEKTNTGLVNENGMLPGGDTVGSILYGGVRYYYPVILKSFKELAKEVFNSVRPNKKEKEALFKVLELLSRKQFNDDTLRSNKLISYTTARKGNDLFLKIVFHPLYAFQSYTNYGALPRDLIERLNKNCKRLSCRTLDLISIISRMEAGVEYKRYERDIMQEINQTEYYNEHKGLAVKNLKNDLKVLEGIGMIYPPVISKRPEGTFYIVKKRHDFCTPEAERIKPIKYPQKGTQNSTKKNAKNRTKKGE